MKFRFSLLSMLVCTAALAVVIAAAVSIDVYETDPARPPMSVGGIIPRQFHIFRPPNAKEIATRMAWAVPLSILLTLSTYWCVKNRPRFTVATFVVLIMCLGVWVGFEVHRVQERKRLLLQVEVEGGTVSFGDTFREKYPKVAWEAPLEVSWLRRLLGDRAVYHLFFVVSDSKDRSLRDSELAPVKAAFPEAIVFAKQRK